MFCTLIIGCRILEKPTFWEEWGRGIVIASTVILFIAFWMFLVYRYDKKKQRRAFYVEHDGTMIDPLRLRSVVLLDNGVIQVVKGQIFVAPLLSKDGYTFAGWFYDSACTIPYINKKISKDITLYPKWVKHS